MEQMDDQEGKQGGKGPADEVLAHQHHDPERDEPAQDEADEMPHGHTEEKVPVESILQTHASAIRTG